MLRNRRSQRPWTTFGTQDFISYVYKIYIYIYIYILGHNSAMEASPINFMKNKVDKMKSLSNLPRKYAGFF